MKPYLSINTPPDFPAVFFLTYIAERNMEYADNEIAAKKKCIEIRKEKGVFFKFVKETGKYKAYHFDLK